jgi:RNA polymerase sigma-70 factor (ECF subfamily)
MDKTQDITQLAEIVVRVQSGEAAARGELIEKIQDRLYKFCLLLAHNRELAQDLCQETFVKVFLNIEKLKNPETFLAWMYQIARNIFIDLKRNPANKEDLSESPEENSSTSPEMDLILQVKRALSQFEPDEQILLLLVELEGYSYKEAGDVLKLSEDAVRSKLHRLRALFISKMKNESGS